jgi:hypothetical protein
MSVIARFILAAFAGALLFLGCSTSPTSQAGGGTDFPNSHTTAAAMGINLSDNIASGNQWGDSVALVDTLPDPTGGISLAVPAMPTTTATTLTYDLSDTATLGIVRAYDSLISGSLTENDTILFLYDAAYRAGVPGNYHIYSYRREQIFAATRIVRRYSCTDVDGDSILNNRNGLPNRAAITWSSTGAPGIDTVIALTIDGGTIDGGADGDLTTAPVHRILASQIGRFDKNGDTLALTTFTAYKGDSVIFDPAPATPNDSCLVRLLTVDNTVLGKRTAGEAILVVFAANSAKNYAAYLAGQTVFPGGRTVFHRVRGVHADSLYFGGDSVIAERVVDSLQVNMTDTLRFTFIKGPDPFDNSCNRLLTLHRHVTRPPVSGAERERIFTLAVDSPLLPDQAPVSGPLYLRQLFSDGYWVQFDGSFGSQTITGAYGDSNGKTGTISWDRAGEVK